MERLSDDIITLNRDVEPFVVQAGTGRLHPRKDPYQPLEFVHFSDLHRAIRAWDRLVEYINYYEKYISFALHTGDYCGASLEQLEDCYANGAPCVKQIYNCVGNHDIHLTNGWRDGNGPVHATKRDVHEALFNHTEGWDVTYMPCEHPNAYYKDFPASNLRLIVLDLYFDTEAEAAWLGEVLTDAREKGLHVITAAHETTDAITDALPTAFHALDDHAEFLKKERKTPCEDVIVAFKQAGGVHVCHLAGHHHINLFGYTAGGVLNCCAEAFVPTPQWVDARREKGTKSYDSFNVVAVDANIGILKLVRVGNNADIYLRTKRVLCFDYINKKMIFTE